MSKSAAVLNRPPGPHARLWALAGPMILSNLAVPLLGLVDTAVLGHLDAPHYLGGVALGAMIFNFLFWGFGFLRMSTTGLTAQAHGEGDALALRAHLGRALLLAVALGLVLVALQGPIGSLAFALIEGSAPVRAAATEYYAVRIFAAPAALANYVLLGWLLGMQYARGPLFLLVFGNALNIGLDLWFVVGLGWGVAGVALGSVLADYAVLAAGLALAAGMLGRHPADWSSIRWLEWRALHRLWAVNRDIFVRTLCLILVFGSFTVYGARFGDAVLAAIAVLLNFQTLLAYALDGFAHAAEALVGRAVGRRQASEFRAAVRAATAWSAGAAVGFSVVYAVFGETLVAVLTDLPRVRESAADYLPWLVLSPLVSVWSYLLDGIFIGATRAREMRDAMLLSALVYVAALNLLQPFDAHGLWAALLVFMAARGLSLGWMYARIGRAAGWT